MSHVGYLVLQSILHMENWQVSPRALIYSLFARRQRCFSLRVSNFAAAALHWAGRNMKIYILVTTICVLLLCFESSRGTISWGAWCPTTTSTNLCTEPSKTETTSHEFKRTFSVRKRNLMLLFHLFQFTRRITKLWNLKRTESHRSPLFQTRKILLFLMKKFQLFQRKFLYSFISNISLCHYY